jgi:rubrerythrin
MSDQVVRCPYCLLADQFRPMLQRPDWFICEQCGHVLLPDDPDFRCACSTCMELNRAA